MPFCVGLARIRPYSAAERAHSCEELALRNSSLKSDQCQLSRSDLKSLDMWVSYKQVETVFRWPPAKDVISFRMRLVAFRRSVE
jgi:hypothetical protein